MLVPMIHFLAYPLEPPLVPDITTHCWVSLQAFSEDDKAKAWTYVFQVGF